MLVPWPTTVLSSWRWTSCWRLVHWMPARDSKWQNFDHTHHVRYMLQLNMLYHCYTVSMRTQIITLRPWSFFPHPFTYIPRMHQPLERIRAFSYFFCRDVQHVKIRWDTPSRQCMHLVLNCLLGVFLCEDPLGLRELKRLTALAKTSSRRTRRFRGSAEGIGSTAVLCCVTPSCLVVANCGDSRAVLCRGGHAIDLSQVGCVRTWVRLGGIGKVESWILCIKSHYWRMNDMNDVVCPYLSVIVLQSVTVVRWYIVVYGMDMVWGGDLERCPKQGKSHSNHSKTLQAHPPQMQRCKDHKPSLPEERARIEEAGAVSAVHCSAVFLLD